MVSDRIFGLVATLVALAYIASATQIQTSFLSDPVGPKTFPILVGAIAAICGIFIVLRPDPDPDWPALATIGALVVSVVVMVAYAYTLKPLGFLIPTAICAGILSYQISPRPIPAVISGLALSLGLFFIFKYALGLGLVAFSKHQTQSGQKRTDKGRHTRKNQSVTGLTGLGHRIAIKCGHQRGFVAGDVEQNGRYSSAIHRAIIDGCHHHQCAGGIQAHAERQRNQDRHTVGRP